MRFFVMFVTAVCVLFRLKSNNGAKVLTKRKNIHMDIHVPYQWASDRTREETRQPRSQGL